MCSLIIWRNMVTSFNEPFSFQPEASFTIKPYLSVLTKSEIFAILVSSFASITADSIAVLISYGVSSSQTSNRNACTPLAALWFLWCVAKIHVARCSSFGDLSADVGNTWEFQFTLIRNSEFPIQLKIIHSKQSQYFETGQDGCFSPGVLAFLLHISRKNYHQSCHL